MKRSLAIVFCLLSVGCHKADSYIKSIQTPGFIGHYTYRDSECPKEYLDTKVLPSFDIMKASSNTDGAIITIINTSLPFYGKQTLTNVNPTILIYYDSQFTHLFASSSIPKTTGIKFKYYPGDMLMQYWEAYDNTMFCTASYIRS